MNPSMSSGRQIPEKQLLLLEQISLFWFSVCKSNFRIFENQKKCFFQKHLQNILFQNREICSNCSGFRLPELVGGFTSCEHFQKFIFHIIIILNNLLGILWFHDTAWLKPVSSQWLVLLLIATYLWQNPILNTSHSPHYPHRIHDCSTTQIVCTLRVSELRVLAEPGKLES